MKDPVDKNQLRLELSDEVIGHLLVIRSAVPPGLPYLQYRDFLRDDFFFSCGYCTLSEYEAQGLRFTIDHYEPQSFRPDLENDYGNLIYACNECNVLKGDLVPPVVAREAGYRFYRPDEDLHDDHFGASGYRLNYLTKVGEFTIEALDLNRQSLRRLREIRERLERCDEFVARGIMALRQLRIDRLPQGIKGRALSAIRNTTEVAGSLAEQIDEVLRSAARSPLLDSDAEKSERQEARAEKLAGLAGLYPGMWRGRRARKTQAQ